jgi:hypothetical protein
LCSVLICAHRTDLPLLQSAESNEQLRHSLFNQVVAVGLGDRSMTYMDMIYVGMEDGRFFGYFSGTSFTERGPGFGMPTDLPWAPYALATVDADCADTSACRGKQLMPLPLTPPPASIFLSYSGVNIV